MAQEQPCLACHAGIPLSARCGTGHCQNVPESGCVWCPRVLNGAFAEGDGEQPQEPEPPSNDNSDQVSLGAWQPTWALGQACLWILATRLAHQLRVQDGPLAAVTQDGYAAVTGRANHAHAGN